MPDASRFPQGIIIEGSLAIARPVGTIVRSTGDGQLYASTDAVIPTYTALTGNDAFPAVLTVALTGGDFATLTAAVAVVAAGQLILVFPGTYVEPGAIAIPNSVSVLGLGGADRTVFSGPAFGGISVGTGCEVQGVTSAVPEDTDAFTMTGTGSTLRQCTATGVGPAFFTPSGLSITATGNVLEDCRISGTFTNGLRMAVAAALSTLVVNGLVFDPASVCTVGIELVSAGARAQPHISNVTMNGTVDTGVNAGGLQPFTFLENVYIPNATTTAFRLSGTTGVLRMQSCTGYAGTNEILIDAGVGGAVEATAHQHSFVLTNNNPTGSTLSVNGFALVADPGTGTSFGLNSIAVYTTVAVTIGAGAETNTLAAPLANGQRISVTVAAAGGGTRAITASAAINAAGNTVMTLNAVRETVDLVAVKSGAAFRWQLVSNDGAVLA